MSVVINTNTAASIAANNLGYASSQLTDAINQLSSGSRLADPAEDPGSVGVSLRLTSAADDAGVQNTIDQNQLASLQTADAAINVTGSIVTRISELATMAGDSTKTAGDVTNYNSEFTSLKAELTSLATAAGSTSAVSALTASGATLTGTGMTTSISNAIAAVGSLAASNGASQAKFGFQSQYDSANETNLEAANSAISDVDVAQESTQLARWNVLVQAGTAMLAQANQTSQVALKLLGD